MTFRQLMVCLIFGPLFAFMGLAIIAFSPFLVLIELLASNNPDPIDLVGDTLAEILVGFKEVYGGRL